MPKAWVNEVFDQRVPSITDAQYEGFVERDRRLGTDYTSPFVPVGTVARREAARDTCFGVLRDPDARGLPQSVLSAMWRSFVISPPRGGGEIPTNRLLDYHWGPQLSLGSRCALYGYAELTIKSPVAGDVVATRYLAADYWPVFRLGGVWRAAPGAPALISIAGAYTGQVGKYFRDHPNRMDERRVQYVVAGFGAACLTLLHCMRLFGVDGSFFMPTYLMNWACATDAIGHVEAIGKTGVSTQVPSSNRPFKYEHAAAACGLCQALFVLSRPAHMDDHIPELHEGIDNLLASAGSPIASLVDFSKGAEVVKRRTSSLKEHMTQLLRSDRQLAIEYPRPANDNVVLPERVDPPAGGGFRPGL